MFRVGFGQDSHRFSVDPTRKLVLGGAIVAEEPGLDGNSDADVVLHALCCSLEQAIGRDGFSQYAGEMCQRGIVDSRAYVEVARSHVEAAGYRINNVGVTIEALCPRIDPLRAVMKANIAHLLGISVDAIGINATSGEQMTPFGQGAGIQAFVIVSLEQR